MVGMNQVDSKLGQGRCSQVPFKSVPKKDVGGIAPNPTGARLPNAPLAGCFSWRALAECSLQVDAQKA